jgi:diguanylate cyclase (GGDEF)-like protein
MIFDDRTHSASEADDNGAGGHHMPRAHRIGESVMIIDVDQSAAIRARHGSAAGEQLAQAVAETLRRRLRPGDRLALLREDEFMAVLPGAQTADLPRIEARLRDGVKGMRLSIAGREWQLSCTIGSACSQQLAEQPRRLDSLVRIADAALYRAKTSSLAH